MMQVTAILTHTEEGGFVAHNAETGTMSQGDTIEDAIANLREAVELYLEEFPMKFGAAPLVTTFDAMEQPFTK
jgi:predicted RNase H-like HicB family nuclease